MLRALLFLLPLAVAGCGGVVSVGVGQEDRCATEGGVWRGDMCNRTGGGGY